MKKIIISLLFVVMLVNVLCVSAFAETGDLKDYNVTYKEVNLYRSAVSYLPEYSTKYVGYKVLEGFNDYETEVKIKGEIYTLESEAITSKKLLNYEIKVFNKNNVFKVVPGKLKVGKNEIKVEFENLLKKKCVYVFTIMVKKDITEEIDYKTYDWEKVEKPNLKWVHKLTYGSKHNKFDINLGETKDYETNKDVYAIGKTFFFIKNKPSDLYSTKNQKLILGDNVLNIWDYKNKCPMIKFTIGRKCYWFKVEFIVNLTEKQDTTTTPGTTTTPDTTTEINTSNVPVTTPNISASIEPSTTNIVTNNDSLPKTGEENPILYFVIGIAFIVLGTVIFKGRKFLFSKNR